MDPEHKLKKKLKNSSKKLKTQAKNSKSRHFLNRRLPEMRSKRKPGVASTQERLRSSRDKIKSQPRQVVCGLGEI